MIIAGYATMLALFVVGQPEALTFESTRLPRAVEVTVESTRTENGQIVPFDRTEARIAEGWVYGTQFLSQGALGYVPFDVTYDNGEETTTYNVGRLRGAIGSRIKSTGTSRLDMLASPIGLLRAAKHLVGRGGSIPTEQMGQNTVYLIQADPRGTIPWRVEVDHETGQILSCTSRVSATAFSRVKYLDWKPLDQATWHPHRIELESQSPEESVSQTYLVKAIRIVDHTAIPAKPVFQPGAIFAVEGTGAHVDASGKVVADPKMSTSGASGELTSYLSGNWLFVAGAITVLGASALILRNRRKGLSRKMGEGDRGGVVVQ